MRRFGAPDYENGCYAEAAQSVSGMVRSLALPLFAALFVAGCVAPVDRRAAPEPPSGLTPKSVVHAERHMIAAANPLAAEAGREILRAGGNAVDAAIAAQMVLNLVEPQSSGIGGGGFLMHFDADTGDIAAHDGRETAPASATPGMFLDHAGGPRLFMDAVVGGLSVGVPGLLRMLEAVHADHGQVPWPDLFQPAIEFAEKGFPVSQRLHTLIARDEHLNVFPSTAAYFLGPDGRAPQVGEKLTSPSFAETLRLVAEGGADVFYEGPIAADIVRTLSEAARNPGGMSVADLASYRAVRRDPVCLFYRAWLICGMPPPSSGGITTLQILGPLQGTDIAEATSTSADAVHLLAEAGRLAFADRNAYVADPDFVDVPTAGLLDPAYLEDRAASIRYRHGGTALPGQPAGAEARYRPSGTGERGLSTTHLSVIDSDGNAVSMATSIETAFGSRLMVRGFLLNNQLTDFSFSPTRNGVPVANRAEPGKRPRSSMAPTLVFDARGRLVAAIGSPGGSRIIGYVAQTLVAVLDWGLDIQSTIDLPHALNRNGPTEIEAGTVLERVRSALEDRGHTVTPRSMTSGLHGIVVAADGLEGGADPCREGAALGD